MQAPQDRAPRDLATIVPDLELPPSAPAAACARAEAPEGEPPAIELSEVPARRIYTGVRSRGCPVCQTELPLAQRICHECGERLFEEGLVLSAEGQRAPLVGPSYGLPRGATWTTPAQPVPVSGPLAVVADHLPMSVAKRLLLYPLLAVFFCNLLIPCRFHQTGFALALALVGLLGVVAHHKTGRT